MISLSLALYFATFSSSLLLSRFYRKGLEKNRASYLLLIILVIIPPVLLSSFRKGIGTDYYGYQEVFESIKSSISFAGLFSFYQEPGWVLINLLSNSYFTVLLISSILYSLIITIAIFKIKNKIGITFPLFVSYMVFYSLSFNGIRQAIAAAFFLLALTYIKKSKLKYIIFIIVGSLFHKSALICLLLLFVFLIKQMKMSKVILTIIVMSVVIIAFSGLLVMILERLHLYTKYTDGSDSSGNGGIGFLLYLLPVTFLLFYLTQRYRINDKFYLFLLFVFLLQIPFQFLGSKIAFADRIAEYGLVSQVFLIPYALKFIKNRNTRIFYLFLYTSWYVFYYIFMFVILKSNGVYPYFVQ